MGLELGLWNSFGPHTGRGARIWSRKWFCRAINIGLEPAIRTWAAFPLLLRLPFAVALAFAVGVAFAVVLALALAFALAFAVAPCCCR